MCEVAFRSGPVFPARYSTTGDRCSLEQCARVCGCRGGDWYHYVSLLGEQSFSYTYSLLEYMPVKSLRSLLLLFFIVVLLVI